MSCTRPWNPPMSRCGSAKATEAGLLPSPSGPAGHGNVAGVPACGSDRYARAVPGPVRRPDPRICPGRIGRQDIRHPYAAHASALRGRPVDLPRRLVRPAAVAFSPRVPAASAKIGAAHVRPGVRANVNCGCRQSHPRHATRRYSLIVPPTRVCLRTRYCSRTTGCGSGFSGAAEWSERCGRC